MLRSPFPLPLIFGVLFALLLGVSAPPSAADPSAPGDGAREAVLSALQPAQRGELAYLEHLGWRLVWDASGPGIRVHGGQPCQRTDLGAAHAAGDLRILVPPGVDPASIRAFGEELRALSDSDASRCAYQQRIRVAVASATRKLAANEERGNLVFPKVLFIDSPFWVLKPPRPEWVKVAKTWRAQASPSQAIEAIYTKEGVIECYVAQLLAQFATQYELYGARAFDQAFDSHDLALGNPDRIGKERFGWDGPLANPPKRHALLVKPEDFGKDPGLVLAPYGPVAYCGLIGVVRDPDTQMTESNENSTIVSVSPAVVEVFKQYGFSYIGHRTKEALEAIHAKRNMLLTGAALQRLDAKVEMILSEPVFTEFMIYVHPYGVVPLREIVEKKFTAVDVPPEFRLYRCGLEDGFFQHYRREFLRRLGVPEAAAATPAPAAAPVPPPPPPPPPANLPVPVPGATR